MIGYVCGTDLSTKSVDFVALPPDPTERPPWVTLSFRLGGGAFNAARRVKSNVEPSPAFQELIATCKHWAIEEPFSKGRGTVKALLRVQGAVITLLPPDVEVVEFRPQEWKRETVGKTNASKEEVAAWCERQGYRFQTQDQADAFAIAWAMRARLRDR